MSNQRNANGRQASTLRITTTRATPKESAEMIVYASQLLAPTAFAQEDQCEARLDQLDEAMDQRELTDAEEDQIDQLRDQAKEYKDSERYSDCISTVDQAMQMLNTAPMKE